MGLHRLLGVRPSHNVNLFLFPLDNCLLMADPEFPNFDRLRGGVEMKVINFLEEKI